MLVEIGDPAYLTSFVPELSLREDSLLEDRRGHQRNHHQSTAIFGIEGSVMEYNL